jgi:hypothetical protein
VFYIIIFLEEKLMQKLLKGSPPLDDIIPKGMKVSKKFQKHFIKALVNSTPKDRTSTCRDYMKLAGGLPNFGVESLEC